MTAQNFVYWLQGFFELSSQRSCPMTEQQVDTIKAHLNLVFAHDIDPKAGPPEVQKKLNDIHSVGSFGTIPGSRC